MTRFEFVTKIQDWVGIHHFRAWRDRMKELAPGFDVVEGIDVKYSFEATSGAAAKALSDQAYEETRFALVQRGPRITSY